MRWYCRAGVILASVVGWAVPAPGVEIDWVQIDAAGNVDDDELRVGPCCGFVIGVGAVDYVYWISAFETTNAQYAEFLNAVAASDPMGLYNTLMGTAQIIRSGSDGSFTYTPASGRENRPVGYIDFYDALRFANWLENGQPTGAEDASTTEDGAYTLLGSNPDQVERNPGALFFLTSLDEWYKAAYYDPDLAAYWDYPTGSDAPPTPEPPPGGTESANFCPAVNEPVNCMNRFVTHGPGDATDVGAYVDSASPFGTFDQGGNALEWNEELVWDPDPPLWLRGFRGGWYKRGPFDLSSFIPDQVNPNLQNLVGMGFRVATLVPEPQRDLLLTVGWLAVLAVSRLRLRAR